MKQRIAGEKKTNELKRKIAGIAQLTIWDNPHAVSEVLKIHRGRLRNIETRNKRQ